MWLLFILFYHFSFFIFHFIFQAHRRALFIIPPANNK